MMDRLNPVVGILLRNEMTSEPDWNSALAVRVPSRRLHALRVEKEDPRWQPARRGTAPSQVDK